MESLQTERAHNHERGYDLMTPPQRARVLPQRCFLTLKRKQNLAADSLIHDIKYFSINIFQIFAFNLRHHFGSLVKSKTPSLFQSGEKSTFALSFLLKMSLHRVWAPKWSQQMKGMHGSPWRGTGVLCNLTKGLWGGGINALEHTIRFQIA